MKRFLEKIIGGICRVIEPILSRIMPWFIFGMLIITTTPVLAADIHHISASNVDSPLQVESWKFKFGDDHKFAKPNFDDSAWEEVKVPQSWTDAGHPQYGWYRLKFNVSSQAKGQELGISLGRIGDADEFYLNGIKIGQTGVMPPEFRNINHKWRVYELDSKHLNYGGTNTVALRVYKEDFHQQGGGLFFGKTQIGDYEKLRFKGDQDYWWTTVKSIILAFLIFFICYDFFILWLKNRRSNELFYLCVTSFFFALISLCQSRFLYEFNFNILYLDKINALALFCMLYYQAKFFETIFDHKIKLLSYLNIFTALVFCAVGFFIPTSAQLEGITAYWIAIAMFIFFPYWYYLNFCGLRTNRSEAKIILIGLTALLAFAINDALAYWGYYVLYDLVPVGFFLLVMSMRHALALRFTQERHEMERSRRWAIVGQASSELAHEVKNSLHPLRIYNEQLPENVNLTEHEFLKDYHETVDHEVGKMSKLVTNILDYAGNKTKRTASIRLEDILNKAISDVDLNGKINITKQFTTNGVCIFADGQALVRSFENIIRNAKESIKDTGEITISTRFYGYRKKYIEIHIADTGEGMTEEVINNIFDPFFTTKAQGTGYGLSIVYKTITAHDGTIKIQSRLGNGSKFIITLPITDMKTEKVIHEV